MQKIILPLVFLILNPVNLYGQETSGDIQKPVQMIEDQSSPLQSMMLPKYPQIQFDFFGQWNFAPSTHTNEAEFLVSKVQLSQRWELADSTKLTVGLHWKSPNKADLNQSGVTSFSKAFISVPWRLEKENFRTWMNFGLLPSTWKQLAEDVLGIKDSGQLYADVFSKYNYENEKDLGVSIQGCGESFFYELSVVNGEGVRSRETSGKKEISILIQKQWTPRFSMLLQYQKGSYDQYDTEVQLKERVRGALIYKNETQQVIIEYGKTKDPADALSLLAMGNTFDAVPYSGQALTGELISLKHSYFVNSLGKTLLQVDQLNPHQGKSNLVLKSVVLGYNYQMNKDLNSTLAFSETNRTSHYGLSSEKDQFLRLTTQLLF